MPEEAVEVQTTSPKESSTEEESKSPIYTPSKAKAVIAGANDDDDSECSERFADQSLSLIDTTQESSSADK